MKSGFLEKLIGRLGRIDPEEVQNYLLRLAQEKGFLETIFNSIQEGIIVTDSNGRITYVNDAACEIFGIDAENSIGKRLDERVRGLGLECALEILRRAQSRHGNFLSGESLHQFLHRAADHRAARRSR